MKIVILDRDGTINHDSDEYIKSPEEWRALPGALEAISRLNHAGYHVVIATNQSGLGRGLMDVAALNAIHKRMIKQLAAVGGRIDAIYEKDGGYEVVDWKTGSKQLGKSAQVQLAMYRLAWAKLSGCDISKISAAFHYVPTGITDQPVDLLDEAALIALIGSVGTLP